MNEILLTFDVEEFDLPLEYGIPISIEEQMKVGKKGLDAINEIFEDPDIRCTLFTTAAFASQFPESIVHLSKKHEIASHTYYHSSFQKDDLKNSRLVLEKITSQKVFGLRMPRMKKIDAVWIQEAGYKYDSSVNPTWIPGRYNNLTKPRTMYKECGFPKIPVSVSPNFRIPLFWLAFKNFPYSYFKRLALQTLKKDQYLSLYFHPWEFTDLNDYKLPWMTKKKSGTELLDRLKRFLEEMKNEGHFITMNSFLNKKII